jgi:hypothetical protein
MSHLLETYSLQTGAKVSSPFIVKNFYPIPKKYITIHNSSGMGSKNYDYFQDLVDEIYPILKKNNIEILQIGGAEDMPLNNCNNIQGKTTYHQTAYIIENSLLHIGNDSFPVHLASAANIPIIAMYSITSPEIAGPYFKSKYTSSNVCCFSPDYNGKKPSFSPNENPKTINTINFENLLEAVEKLLNIDTGYKIKTLFKGEKYLAKVIDFIPDTVMRPDFAPGSLVNMRVDFCKDDIDENLIFLNIQGRKFNVFVNNKKKIISIDALQSLKDNIINLYIDITDEPIDKKYIEALLNRGIKPIILYTGQDDEYFNESKIDLINFNLNFVRYSPKITKLDDAIGNNEVENIMIKTNRVILSASKIYLSVMSYLNGQDSNSNIQKLIDIKDYKKLDKDLEFCYLYNKEVK